MSISWLDKSQKQLYPNNMLGKFYLEWSDNMHCEIFIDTPSDESFIGELAFIPTSQGYCISDITIFESDKGYGTEFIKTLLLNGYEPLYGESLESAEYFWSRFVDLENGKFYKEFSITKENCKLSLT